jgi:hypothetical protein
VQARHSSLYGDDDDHTDLAQDSPAARGQARFNVAGFRPKCADKVAWGGAPGAILPHGLQRVAAVGGFIDFKFGLF